MKKIIHICLIFSSIILFSQTKLKLKDFEFSTYDINHGKTLIYTYSTLDKNGKLLVYLDDHLTRPIYFEYNLKESEIKYINDLLEKKTLHSFIKTKKLEENTFYTEERNYISFKRKNKIDKMCFINPLMYDDFQKIANILHSYIYDLKKENLIEQFQINIPQIKEKITLQNKIDNFLPEKSLPPPPMRQ